MFLKRLIGIAAGVLLVGMAADARADIIFSTAQGSVNPDENVLFNCPECVSGPALTVVGATNQSGTLITFTGEENLVTPAQGQARIVDEGGDGYFSILIDADDPNVFFSEFEANVRIFAQTSGDATIEACNQFGVCETFLHSLDSGENFFVLSVVSPQLIDTVLITTDVGIMDLRQIRVTVEEGVVPEPASLALFGLALAFGASRVRRKISV